MYINLDRSKKENNVVDHINKFFFLHFIQNFLNYNLKNIIFLKRFLKRHGSNKNLGKNKKVISC